VEKITTSKSDELDSLVSSDRTMLTKPKSTLAMDVPPTDKKAWEITKCPFYEFSLDFGDQPPPSSQLAWELCFYKLGITPEMGGLGRAGHFRKIAEILWGPKSSKEFIWHPWAERMNNRVHSHPVSGKHYPHVALSGCSSSGKTELLAIYAIINWLCAPTETLCLVTSTDLKASRKRVWGSVVEYYKAIETIAPGKLTDSMGILRTDDGTGMFSDKMGIALVAGEKKAELEAMGKLIGLKQKRVFLLADELAELTQALLDTAIANLSSNEQFQIIAASNFKSRLDPFGVFSEPIDGYDMTDTLNLEEWETKLGWCLHFDGSKSPNILEGKDIWPIYGMKQYENHKKTLGENTALFYRFVRSAEPPMGIDNTIYSDSEFAVGKVFETPTWMDGWIPLAASDPAYTNGGDRFILYFGKLGRTTEGLWTLFYDGFEALREDVTKAKERLRSYQMADQIIAKCKERGIKPENFAMDVTAAGNSLADVVVEVWRDTEKLDYMPSIHRVNFSAGTTDRVATADGKLSCDLYSNRVSELWYVGKDYMRFGQIKGLAKSTAREFKARKFESIKSADGFKIRVEPKPEMKLRLTFSPDEADAAFILLDLAREKHGFVPSGRPTDGGSTKSDWQKVASKYDEPYWEENQYSTAVTAEY
jgi:hypothetical protein